MSRYTGPRARVSRRLGVNIWGTKGEVDALERRPYPPGEHGRSRRRGNVSEYLLPAPGEAEGPLHLRPDREAVPQPLRGGQPQVGRHRREHAAVPRAASRQRRLPRRVGRHSPPGPSVRQPRPRQRQRPAGRHPELPGPQGRRRRAALEGPRHDRRAVELRRARSPAAGLAGAGGDFRSRSASCPSASRSTCPSASSSSSSSTASSPRLPAPVAGPPPRPPVTPPRGQRHAGHSAPDRRTDRRRAGQPPEVHRQPARARLRPHDRQLAAAHAAVVDPGRGRHPGPLRRRAPRVRHDRRDHRGRHRHPVEPQGPRAALAPRRARRAAPRRQGQGRRHRRRPGHRSRRRGPQPRPAHRHAQLERQAGDVADGRARPRLPVRRPHVRRAHHRGHPRGRHLLARSGG